MTDEAVIHMTMLYLLPGQKGLFTTSARLEKLHYCRRALFGSEEECITSLAAWQHMCTEARWVGRALFDAEEMVLRSTQ